ncbi:Hypothetical protein CINCED_3A022759 [Cinara cedri]|uniref:Uncharacterized protein n=1 Tax=Cinara cedri TaxID=506608 RepID=A0A5E4NC63_9HEMI|nr:Hypothetical protein CINCED_3A022759 [Cinara cedri]
MKNKHSFIFLPNPRSIKPVKLKEHLVSLHPQHASDNLEVFQTKKARFEKGGTLTELGFVPPQKPCLKASYKVAYRIARNKKPHTIGESLIKSCALEMVELKNLGSLYTDGVPAMLGKSSGFTALIKKEILDIITHCFLHRHALTSKTLPTDLKEIMTITVKIVIFIRARALNHRHEVLLYHTEVRWLSRGQVMKRVYELRKEISFFLVERQSSLAKHFNNIEFIHGLAYLTDIFNHLNEFLRNPFIVDLNTIDDSDLVKDELIDLRSKEITRQDFQTKNLIEFWCSLTKAYPLAVSRAVKFLIPFSTTYFWDFGIGTGMLGFS